MLDIDAALKLLARDGPLALSLKGFELREAQNQMTRNILEAYNKRHIVLIEAGTGTGKSLSYLLPAMLWATEEKERTVISTNTITLQEQLINKDIPQIAKALDLEIKAVLVKGMSNYLCKRKFEDAYFDVMTPEEYQELQKIEGWKENTQDGSRSSLPFGVSNHLWEKIAAESDTCNRNACPYYQECLFFKARKQAAEAKILIVNHHLLFADLVRRGEAENFKDPAILPPYERIILDEAHNIEDIATEYFANSTSQLDLFRLMARLASEKGGKVQGKLPLIKEKLNSLYRGDLTQEALSLHTRLTIDLPGLRNELLLLSQETFKSFFEFANQSGRVTLAKEESLTGDQKMRILPINRKHLYWQETLVPAVNKLIDALQRFSQAIKSLEQDFKQLDRVDDSLKGMLFEIAALANRFLTKSHHLREFMKEEADPTQVQWMELQALKTMINTVLINANLNIAETLSEYLFSKFQTVVLCSATLATNKKFEFIRKRLGLTPELLPERVVKEYIYESPFDFKRQALLVIPKDLPSPSDPSFLAAASQSILSALQASRGNAFVLFTSYTMLKQCFSHIENALKEQRYNLLKQGDDDRHVLLKKFKTTDRSVLFGTDSFWEGVDIVGEALRCVIIVKLPFKVPSEPIIQARSEEISARGGEPFYEYSLPHAIVKFKQGFGRLIRNKKDRGCVVCLDNRMLTKKYGSLFLNSLPDCYHSPVQSKDLLKVMLEFYKNTHFLTSQTKG